MRTSINQTTAASYSAAAAAGLSSSTTPGAGAGHAEAEPLSDEFRARVRALGERLGVAGIGEGGAHQEEALVTLQVGGVGSRTCRLCVVWWFWSK